MTSYLFRCTLFQTGNTVVHYCMGPNHCYYVNNRTWTTFSTPRSGENLRKVITIDPSASIISARRRKESSNTYLDHVTTPIVQALRYVWISANKGYGRVFRRRRRQRQYRRDQWYAGQHEADLMHELHPSKLGMRVLSESVEWTEHARKLKPLEQWWKRKTC